MRRDFDNSESSLVLGTITGYRSWTLSLPVRKIGYKFDWAHTPWGKHSFLYSHCGTKWKVSGIEADCNLAYSRGAKHQGMIHDGKPPVPMCSCGIYAYYLLPNALRHSGSIHGVIQAWGNTLLGTRGFRTQKAKVVALVLPKTHSNELADMVAHLASHYNVPWFNNPNDLLRNFPPSDITNLMPS